MQETRIQSLGWQDPLEKGMATHSSIFFLFIIFIWLHQVLVEEHGIYFNQGPNPGPLHWEHGVLATGLPGKSQLQYSCLENSMELGLPWYEIFLLPLFSC